MKDFKIFDNEQLFRNCSNADYDSCQQKEFIANSRKRKFCSNKCRDDYHNRKKRKLRDNQLSAHTSNNYKFQLLRLNNNEMFLTQKGIEELGILLDKYDERIQLNPYNEQYILRFGEYYMTRIEEDVFRIFTKNHIK